MKVLTASIIASICGLLGLWLLEARQWAEDWAGLESSDVKWGGTSSDDEPA